MEQIKRQLVAQRGSIVAALKLVAQTRSVRSGIYIVHICYLSLKAVGCQ